MKYKDFKTMSENEMKGIKGGNAVDCTASVTCGNGRTYTCAGNNGTALGSGMGCNAQTGSSATCYYIESGNSWAAANIQCNGSGAATTSWSTIAQ